MHDYERVRGLRFVERNGARILQMKKLVYTPLYGGSAQGIEEKIWLDVPLEEEKEQSNV